MLLLLLSRTYDEVIVFRVLGCTRDVSCFDKIALAIFWNWSEHSLELEIVCNLL